MRVWAIWSSYVYFTCLDWFVKGLRTVSEGLLNKGKPKGCCKVMKGLGPHLTCLSLVLSCKVKKIYLPNMFTISCWMSSEPCPPSCFVGSDVPQMGLTCRLWCVVVLPQLWPCWHGHGERTTPWMQNETESSACCISSSPAFKVCGLCICCT